MGTKKEVHPTQGTPLLYDNLDKKLLLNELLEKPH